MSEQSFSETHPNGTPRRSDEEAREAGKMNWSDDDIHEGAEPEPVDSREVYNDSFDGGYGADSYFSWAMNKDD
jgi:hypothetical protein